MAKPPDRELLSPLDQEKQYDYERIQNIVAALEYLRREAVKTGSEEICTLINSTFNMCFTLYYLFLRSGHIAAANEN
jgi:hypothetical protein